MIHVAEDLMDAVIAGTKRSTIRRGTRTVTIGVGVLRSDTRRVPVSITSVRVATLDTLTAEEIAAEGVATTAELVRLLQRFYPDLAVDEPITVVAFELTHPALAPDGARA